MEDADIICRKEKLKCTKKSENNIIGRKKDDKWIMSAQKHYTILMVIPARHSNNSGSNIFH